MKSQETLCPMFPLARSEGRAGASARSGIRKNDVLTKPYSIT